MDLRVCPRLGPQANPSAWRLLWEEKVNQAPKNVIVQTTQGINMVPEKKPPTNTVTANPKGGARTETMLVIELLDPSSHVASPGGPSGPRVWVQELVHEVSKGRR